MGADKQGYTRNNNGLLVNELGRPDPDIFRSDDVKTNGALPSAAVQLLESYYGGTEQEAKDHRSQACQEYIQALLDPSKHPSEVLSNTELWYIAASMTEAEANELKNNTNTEILKYSKEIYKYNINVSGPNEFLEDVRNYHNFRSQFDEYPKSSPSIAGKPDMFGGGTVRAGTSPSKSYYMSAHDFLFSEQISFDASQERWRAIAMDPSQVQPIVLNEFQPDAVIFNTKLMTTGLESALNLVQSVPTVGNFVKTVKGIMETDLTGELSQNIGLRIANRILAEYSVNPEGLYGLSNIRSGGGAFSKNPIHFIQTMFDSGNWLNTYELPFFNDSYLKSDKHTAWATGRT